MSTGKEQLDVEDDFVAVDADEVEQVAVEPAKTNLSKRRTMTIFWKNVACKNSWRTTISICSALSGQGSPPGLT